LDPQKAIAIYFRFQTRKLLRGKSTGVAELLGSTKPHLTSRDSRAQGLEGFELMLWLGILTWQC